MTEQEPIPPEVRAAETPLKAFVSSTIGRDVQLARDQAAQILGKAPYLQPWVFEYTPASSEHLDDSYLRHVRESDVVIWLVGADTTEPVKKEIQEALSTQRRLWVFLFPENKRTAATTELLQQVGARVKRLELHRPEEFNQALELTFHDEIIRAWRRESSMSRLAVLEELGRASRARCIERWQSAGVPYQLSAELADNPSVGLPRKPFPATNNRVMLLVGDIGVGKSLFAERLLQEAIVAARHETDAPIPVYLEAIEINGRLEEYVRASAQESGDPRVQGAFIVVDDAHEVGLGQAAQLLRESRILAGSWPNSVIVMTSRPIPGFGDAEEAITVQPLGEEDASAIISKVAGYPVTLGIRASWSQSIRETVRRPLFAVLMGSFLKGGPDSFPSSEVELMEHLIKRSLGNQGEPLHKANSLLRQLGGLSTDRGGPVPSAEVVSSRDELELLLGSTVVVDRKGALSFPLPIFREWFASQCLVTGNVKIEDLLQDGRRLERWRQAIIFAVGTLSYSSASALLGPITRGQPAVASIIVTEAITRWSDEGDESPLPPVPEMGSRIRDAMDAWIQGIGPLARLTGPVKPDGTTCPLGLQINRRWVTTSWYRGNETVPDVMDLPPSTHVLGAYDPTWPSIHHRQVGNQPAWAWRDTHGELVESVTRLLDGRRLPMSDGPLLREEVWEFALSVAGHSSLYSESISLQAIRQSIDEWLTPNLAAINIGGRTYERVDLIRLVTEIDRLITDRQSYISEPWPSADKELFSSSWVWDLFSEERLLERTRAIYAGALVSYEQLVNQWFPNFADRLDTMIMLPARVHGILYRPERTTGFQSGPGIFWRLEPLSPENSSFIDILPEDERHGRDDFGEFCERVRAMRPKFSEWLGISEVHGILDVFGPRPATNLAYHWIASDLRRLSWVN